MSFSTKRNASANDINLQLGLYVASCRVQQKLLLDVREMSFRNALLARSRQSLVLVRALSFTVVLVCAASLKGEVVTVPPDLSPGDQYRLTFTTSQTRNALSPNIEDYNDFVQSLANASTELATLGAEWRVIGSTSEVDAITNTDTDPSILDIPIYRIDGELAVPNYGELWNMFGLQSLVRLNVDEFGDLIPTPPLAEGVPVFHGSTRRGRVGLPLGGPDETLRIGFANGGIGQYLNGSAMRPSAQGHFYALSEVLTVVPEPSSSSVVVTLLFALFVFARRTRQET